MFVTCEAKQTGERILEDQILEQVKIAFHITKGRRDRPIEAVKPMAIQVLSAQVDGQTESAIYVVEFKHFLRSEFEQTDHQNDPEAIYKLDLEMVSGTLYILRPAVSGLK
jgi:hypothetical protein